MLSLYDVDKKYHAYLQQVEIEVRGFTRIPNMDYEGEQKFLCGVVLDMGKFNYYVPATSYKKKQSENILIVVESDKYNKIKGSLRFNYMFPVPDGCINERVIKNEQDKGRRMFLNAQLQFCLDNETQIRNQAKRTYTIITKKLNPLLLDNSCDFSLLEAAFSKYVLPEKEVSKHPTEINEV